MIPAFAKSRFSSSFRATLPSDWMNVLIFPTDTANFFGSETGVPVVFFEKNTTYEPYRIPHAASANIVNFRKVFRFESASISLDNDMGIALMGDYWGKAIFTNSATFFSPACALSQIDTYIPGFRSARLASAFGAVGHWAVFFTMPIPTGTVMRISPSVAALISAFRAILADSSSADMYFFFSSGSMLNVGSFDVSDCKRVISFPSMERIFP